MIHEIANQAQSLHTIDVTPFDLNPKKKDYNSVKTGVVPGIDSNAQV